MEALQLIKDNLDVERILEHYDFDNVTERGNHFRACCKLHDGQNRMAFAIHQDEGLWTCHTGECGSGDVFTIVQKMEGVSFPVAVHRVAEILNLDITNLEIVARTKQEHKELRAWMKTMKSMLVTETLEYTATGKIKSIKAYKGFKKDTLKEFGVMFFESFTGTNAVGEEFTLSDFLGFPIYKKDILIGMSLRSTRKNEFVKWIHQPSHIKTGELLYNFDNALGQKEVVVVEGITDVWAYHEIGKVAVCTYGASISQVQKRLLTQLGSDLVFSFDGDEAGRSAMRQAYDMFKSHSNIKFVHLPQGHDPENITREELTTQYEKRNNFPI